jgi:hypothetical protein
MWSSKRIGGQMGESYDVERLRRELAEYGDLQPSRDERSLQALMGELIQLTGDPNEGSRVLESTATSGAAKGEDHSIERAAAHFRPDVEPVSRGAVAPSHAEDAQQGAVVAQPGSTTGVFSARQWAVVCVLILILMGTVASGFFVFWRNGPQTTVSIPITLEPPSRSEQPSGPAPVRPDASEPAAAAERIERAVAAPVEVPQPVASTEGAAPATGQAAAEVSKPTEPALPIKPASQKAKKKSTSRRRAPGLARP